MTRRREDLEARDDGREPPVAASEPPRRTAALLPSPTAAAMRDVASVIGNRAFGRLAELGAFASPPADATRLAEQVGHFVVEPTSRSSGRVRLHAGYPPTVRRDGDDLVLEATYDRDGAPWPVTVVARPSGEVSVRHG